jgi:DNA-binding GntR family transcriptional regulator
MTRSAKPPLRSEGFASMEDWAYTTTKEWIITLELKPGEVIVEADLADSLGVSKTPLRSALLQLERDGFVTSIAYKGSRVRPISASSVQKLFQLREALESFAMVHFVETATPEDIQALQQIQSDLKAAYETGDLETAYRRDAAFHEYPVQHLRNPHFARLMTNISDHRRRLRHALREVLPDPKHMMSRHNALLRALKKHDVERARAQVIDGIRAFQQVAANAAKAGTIAEFDD